MSGTTSGAEILARIKPKLREETVELCLASDLFEEWGAVQDELVASRQRDTSGNRLADGESAKSRELAQKVKDVEARIAEHTIEVRLRAMSKDQWRALCDTYPPRKGDQLDAYAGYNRSAVLDDAVRKCMVDPVFADCVDEDDEPRDDCDHTECGTWQQFESTLNPGEWQALVDTANSVNRGVVEAPKSELASRILARRATG
jgi:hypothetical protein